MASPKVGWPTTSCQCSSRRRSRCLRVRRLEDGPDGAPVLPAGRRVQTSGRPSRTAVGPVLAQLAGTNSGNRIAEIP